jgi:hypothetical protein
MTKAYKAGAIAYAMSYTMGVLGEIGGYGAQMLGGGINGYVQTGTSKGFWRGFAAGAIPNNLGVDAYYGSGFAAGFANLAIGVVRDGIRGAIVADSSKGFAKGALYGQANNIVGHIVGMVSTGALPKFENGAFIYEGEFWKELGAITFGNVISGSQSFLEGQMPRGNYTVLQHERGHIPQSTALGVAYIPAHAISLSVSWLFGERDARGKRNTHGNINLLENSLHQYPDNGSAPGSSLDWFYGTRYK